VLLLVLKNGLVLAGTGIIVGLGIARGATRFLAPLLHNVTPYDPFTYVVVPVVLVAVAVAASLVPAWRASRVDPLRALRSGS
jgi:putative ABC transport system permease protein